jgi:hypothetical protein
LHGAKGFFTEGYDFRNYNTLFSSEQYCSTKLLKPIVENDALFKPNLNQI